MVKTCLYQIEWLVQPPRPALPVELWEKILDLATEPPLLFDTHTEPDKFYRFIRNQMWSSDYLYRRSKGASKQLRMVCRLWNSIVSRFPRKWVMRMPASDHRNIPNGVRRLGFRADRSHFNMDPNLLLEIQQTEPIHLPFVPIVSFTPTESDVMEQEFSSVIEKVEKLACPYTLIFDGFGHSTPRILQAIERTFSNLTTLLFPHLEISGTLSLPRLEVLYIIGTVDISSWRFPSLRHLAVGMDFIYHGEDMIWPYPIPGPLTKLQSLLLPVRHGHFQADADFWRTHPSLHLLGICSKQFDVVDKPPPNHPFSHLLYVDGQQALLNTRPITNTMRRLPDLRVVTIPIHTHDLRSECVDAFLFMQLTHWRRGVRWLDFEGNEIRFRELRKKAERRNWEWIIFIIYFITNLNLFLILGLGIQILPITISPWSYSLCLMYICWVR
jgi:hypothetical protein